MRLLLVDDDAALRELLRATFESFDIEVLEAASGEEAEATVRRELPDVIVLDVLTARHRRTRALPPGKGRSGNP